MSLSPEVEARIQTVETKVSELDPILHEFCVRNGYHFSSMVGVWPRRSAWAREEIDRTLDLTMDLTVPEVMERGFYSEMTWSLYATASLMMTVAEPNVRFLSEDVFRGLPFSQLSGVLAERLEEGLRRLQRITREDVLTKGQILGGPKNDECS